METAQIRMTPIRISILLLGLATALVHLQLTFPSVMFILNGLGYLALLGAYFLPVQLFQENHNLVRWAFIAYTAVTIIGWVAFGSRITIAYIDKAIEVLLIVLLYADSR